MHMYDYGRWGGAGVGWSQSDVDIILGGVVT